MSEPLWKAATSEVATWAEAAGLDLVQPFAVTWYNATASADQRLVDFDEPRSLGILLGNTRALWPVFTRAVAEDAELGSCQHPLDRYVEKTLEQIASRLAPRRSRSYFAHTTRPFALPLQRLAELAGLAMLSPSHLAIHPVHGPWLGLRAVLIVDMPGPDAPTALERPCVGCSRPCMAPLEQALEVSGSPLTAQAIAEHAPAWIAVRDACPVGRDSRYGEAQLRYHYQPSRRHLIEPRPER